MRVPRCSAALFVTAALAIVLVATVVAHGRDTTVHPSATSWLGLVGGARAPVQTDERMIVLLKTPSVAQRVAEAHYATESQERVWRAAAYAAQEQVLLTLSAEGISIKPDFSYYRVVDGFSATLDGRAIALLQAMPEVSGVYPVRVAYPASISGTLLGKKEFGALSGHRPTADLPGYDGQGVTIALLDTGVDEAHAYLRGRIEAGYDFVGSNDDATAQHNPQDPTQIETHGTEMAGLLVGAGGPDGLHGVAPGATILPLRVAGWQPAADGSELVYSRTDQLIAGLERAVDPNDDGDSHDAVRIAVIGVAEPYAAFTDAPEAQAMQGALDLNTVVVTPAGNDGGAGPSFGSVSGPSGSPAALAVGASDSRTTVPAARVVLRRGLDVIFDQTVPLLGPVEPMKSLTLRVASPRSAGGVAGTSPTDFYDAKGFSLVAGSAVVLPIGSDPEHTAAAASSAGAALVVLYGSSLPPGALPVAEDETSPVVVVPTTDAAELLDAQHAGIDVGVAIGPAHDIPNPTHGDVAAFSSRGLAFDGGIKPDVVAPGIALATSEPGTAADGSPLYGTINGTSGAAATVAASAALLAELRPALNGPELESLLVGYAQRGRAPATSVGAGTLRVGASAVGEVAAQPTTLGFGLWAGTHWHATRTLVVTNVSSRRLVLSMSALADQDSEALNFTVKPNRLVLRVGRSADVQVTVRAPTAPPTRLVTGVIQIAPDGGEALHVPWALEFKGYSANLLQHVSLNEPSFKASDTSPALLSVQAGAIVHDDGLQIQPVSRLDILLYSSAGKYLGVLSRLRDLLPGSYSFGITGRGPTSVRLPPGGYELRLAAWPTLPLDAAPSRAQISFRIE